MSEENGKTLTLISWPASCSKCGNAGWPVSEIPCSPDSCVKDSPNPFEELGRKMSEQREREMAEAILSKTHKVPRQYGKHWVFTTLIKKLKRWKEKS